jgi:hypothetical protein
MRFRLDRLVWVRKAEACLKTERKFYFQSTIDGEEKHCLRLEHGSLVIMGQGCHETYVHSLPPDNSVKLPRLNLTFRKTRLINNPSLISV